MIKNSFNTDKMKILSGSTLKLIATLSMLLDHIGAFIVVFFESSNYLNILYCVLRSIGRIAFPIYCFLITEGFIHTSNRKKYGVNLVIFAFVSELPWELITAELNYSKHNVYFTLLFGYLGLCAIDDLENEKIKQAIAMISLFALAYIFDADYGVYGFGFIMALYVLRNKKTYQAVICSCLAPSGIIAMFAFIPINMYNGKRGFIKGKLVKYLFYGFYPLHLIVLYIIQYYIRCSN